MEERIARLEGRLDEIEGKLDRMTGLLERLLDEKPAAPAPAPARPEVAASLERIASLAPELEYVAHGLASAPALVGEGVELAQSMAAHGGVDGEELQRRLFASTDLLLALTEPEVLASLARIAQAAPSLEYLVAGLSAAPELLGEAADLLRGMSAAGGDLDARLRGMLAVAEAVTAPEALLAIQRLAGQPRTLALLAELGEALGEAPAVSQPVGPLGLLAVLRDPEIQRTLGAALSVSRRLGRSMDAPT